MMTMKMMKTMTTMRTLMRRPLELKPRLAPLL
jgi:hypothetical protein